MPTKKPTNKAGRFGEDFACVFLQKKGYKIIERNFRSKFGEIDIITIKYNVIVFVEVKARWNLNYGYPEEAVTPSKLWKIKKTAEYYLMLHPEIKNSIRLEVLSIQMQDGKVINSRIIIVD